MFDLLIKTLLNLLIMISKHFLEKLKRENRIKCYFLIISKIMVLET